MTVIEPAVSCGPGANMPPLVTCVLPTLPVPASVPPPFTLVRLDDAIEPFTIRAPASTVVTPVYVLAAERISVPCVTLTAVAPLTDPSVMPVFEALPGASFIVNGATPAKNSALTSAAPDQRLINGVSLLTKFDGEFAAQLHRPARAPAPCATFGDPQGLPE